MDPVGRVRRSRHPAKSRIPCLISCPAALRLHGPTGCEPVSGSCRPGKAQPPPGNTTGTVPDYCPAALRLHGPKRQPDGSLSLRERARVRGSTAVLLFSYRWLQRSLRSRLIVCAMSLMAQGAHRGRPVAAAPCTPGLRPATSPLRGAFDLSLQASGRAEAASVQNTALSPHPCGLPRPSGNVSAMLRPPAPAVSAAPGPAVIWGCRPGKAQPPPGEIKDTVPDILPGGAALARAYGV